MMAIDDSKKDSSDKEEIKLSNREEIRHSNSSRIKRHFIVEEILEIEKKDNLDTQIEEFIRTCSELNPSPLIFWSNNEQKFPLLAKLAKKYLSVQASSAAVERMFSIAGHIFSIKRRRMTTTLFMSLVFLKLNENYM